MAELHCRNVNDAMADFLWMLKNHQHPSLGIGDLYGAVEGLEYRCTARRVPNTMKGSRDGQVIELDEPLLTHYSHPWERVLFNPVRDCNPFFHVYEAIWMLAGRDDVKSLAFYNKRMRDYSDNGNVFWGAYGYRWREWFDHDQLLKIIRILQTDRSTRRVVLGMWDPSEDLALLHRKPDSKDFPCNTHIYFKPHGEYLNMTVCCRSNDMVWGGYGANYVHMSMLHEFISSAAGFHQGRYTQLSDSAHLYTGRASVVDLMEAQQRDTYEFRRHTTVRLLSSFNDDPELFLEECNLFVETFGPANASSSVTHAFASPFLHYVAQPMCIAWREIKHREYKRAIHTLNTDCHQWDWKQDALRWALKRKEAYEQRQAYLEIEAQDTVDNMADNMQREQERYGSESE